MLIILIALIVIGIVGWIFLRKYDFEETLGFITLFFVIISVVGTLVISIVWPAQFYEHKANIAVYHAISDSIENARTGEVNETLASAKYWNKTIFGDLIPDEFAELDYLK
ncbi:hypothetical protein D3C74_411820 [compost metagenome]